MARIAIVPQPSSSRWPARNPDIIEGLDIVEASDARSNAATASAPVQSTANVAPAHHPGIPTDPMFDVEDQPVTPHEHLATPVPSGTLPPACSSLWALLCGNLATRLSGTGAEIRYPMRFKALGAAVVVLALTWIMNYLLAVLPTINAHQDSPCKFNDNQLSQNAKMLFVYFVWFAVARLLLFVPCIATRVALVQARTHGFCKTYLVHLVLRDGPLYIFVMGSLLFWFHLMQSPNCPAQSPELYHALNLYAIYSCMLSLFCLVLAYWHNKLLVEAMRDIYEHVEAAENGTSTRAAPPDTAASFTTQKYDSATFGDDLRYPPECPICLIVWEADDVIKVTPCDHAFHEECVSNWLKTSRVCPICRQDITVDGGARRLARDTDSSLPTPQSLGAPSPDFACGSSTQPQQSSSSSDVVPMEMSSSGSNAASSPLSITVSMQRQPSCTSCGSHPSNAAAPAVAGPRVAEP